MSKYIQLFSHIEVNDSEKAEAFIYLAEFAKSNHYFELASEICQNLINFRGPESGSAKALLREMRQLTK